MNKIVLILLAIPMFFFGCTDLEVEELDSVLIQSDGGAFSGVQPDVALGAAYNNDLTNIGEQNDIYSLLEISSDELLVPTRGTDWGDNGVWRVLHDHTWTPTHEYTRNAWNELNSAVFSLNQIIAPESNANAQQLAEAKFLRAYNMYLIMDLWGQVPFRGVNDGVDVSPQVLTGQAAFDFILKDVNEAIEDLPVVSPPADLITATRAAGSFLLAKLLLNKHIFLGQPNADATDMTAVVAAVDAITDDGFELEDDFFEIFDPAPDMETIFMTVRDAGPRIWNTLHYNQNDFRADGGWNGFSTTADFYALFEGDPDTNEAGSGQEERRGFVPNNGLGFGFLVGQQYADDGTPIRDRAGNPLSFTKDFPALVGNNERTGIRVLKYHPSNGGEFPNRQILFRYADAHLMKAEAILRGGSSGESALELVNELRDLRGASPMMSVELMDILDERGRELYAEGWRRNDQIRFGTFNDTWSLKTNTEEFRKLYAIPAQAIATNPNLVQNPGY